MLLILTTIAFALVCISVLGLFTCCYMLYWNYAVWAFRDDLLRSIPKDDHEKFCRLMTEFDSVEYTYMFSHPWRKRSSFYKGTELLREFNKHD